MDSGFCGPSRGAGRWLLDAVPHAGRTEAITATARTEEARSVGIDMDRAPLSHGELTTRIPSSRSRLGNRNNARRSHHNGLGEADLGLGPTEDRRQIPTETRSERTGFTHQRRE